MNELCVTESILIVKASVIMAQAFTFSLNQKVKVVGRRRRPNS